MEREHMICFVCRNKTTLILNDESNWGARRRTTASRLENNLDVIFILRNLLQVPSNELESQLRGCGDHPEDWISLCDQCTQLTDKARYLHQEIKEIRKHLWEKILLSSTDDDDTEKGNRADHGSSIEFQKKIRSFVKQNNHNDEFLEGDKLANYLASQQNSSAPVENLMDVVEEVMEVESSSSPSASPIQPTAEKGDPVTANSSEKPDEENEYSIQTTGKRRRSRIQAEVKQKKIILSSTDDNTEERKRAYRGCSTEFQLKIRPFIKQNNDNDGLLEGDKVANNLAAPQQNSSTAQNATVENPVDFVEQVLEMEVESLSSTPAAEKGDPVTANTSKKPDEVKECSIKTTSKRKRIRRRRRRIEVEVKKPTIKKKEEPAVRCNLCEKEFKGKHYLKNHIRFVHEKKFNWTCPVCGYGARTKDVLNTHLLAVHSEDPVSKRLEMEEGLKLSRCEVVGCFAQYLNKEKLDEHVARLHGGDKMWSVRFKCKLCGKGFWGKHKLEAHEDTHVIVTERNWKCGVCGNRFGKERNLRDHEIKIHRIYKKDRIAQN